MTPQLLVGFQFTVIWFDEGSIQLCVSAWNGTFGGTAEVYEALGKLENAAGSLIGFPLNPSDKREIIFGNFDRKWAGGGVRMRFHCVDGAGHAYVEAAIDSKYESGGTVQTVLLSMPVEAAAIDAFVQGLQAVGINRAGTAYLKGPGVQL
jgi:hypothetical protein